MALSNRRALRLIGLGLAIASVLLPAIFRGPLFAQPPLPLAVLWAAYGWAAEDESGWRAPLALAALGLLHDMLAGGPYGLFVVLYLSAYLVGRGAAVLMSAPNLLSLWSGFAFTAAVTVAIAALAAPIAFGGNVSIALYLEAALITAALFPLVRPLYMSTHSLRAQQGSWR